MGGQNLLAYISETYKYLFTDLADPRTNDWFLISSPSIFLIIGIYVYVVMKLGPKYMSNREPFELKNTLIIYNFLQVLVSVYIFYEGLDAAWLRDYNLNCEAVDFTMNPKSMRVARGCYIYYIAKITELLDTIFFVMRKKDKQITFLHMYHHSVMPLISWAVVKYYPGGHGTFIGVINSFVHIIMYFYYMMSAMGPMFQKYLWWKKYITTLQLFQFAIAFIHSMQLFFYDCGYPRWTVVFTMPNAVLFYYLFTDFYKKVYVDEKTEKVAIPETTCKDSYPEVNSKLDHKNKTSKLAVFNSENVKYFNKRD